MKERVEKAGGGVGGGGGGRGGGGVVGDEGVKGGGVKLEEMPAGVVDREETEGERHVTGTGLVFLGVWFHLGCSDAQTETCRRRRSPASAPASPCTTSACGPQRHCDRTCAQAHLSFCFF